ncbi:hypothetical protein [Nannocystis pusilla]
MARPSIADEALDCRAARAYDCRMPAWLQLTWVLMAAVSIWLVAFSSGQG